LIKSDKEFSEFGVFYKRYILFYMRLPTLETNHVSIFLRNMTKCGQCMPKLLPKGCTYLFIYLL